ncbi:hypothetical protein AS149_25370 [Burkholderia cenocepacia]|nr:hypothetical protein AS149_25370 [Burkholderia cenocepacia]
MFEAALPEFVISTLCAADVTPTEPVNVSAVGFAAIMTCVPLPDRFTAYVPPAVATLRVPLCVPIVVGENTALIEHVAFFASTEPQSCDALKGPFVVMPEILRSTLPVLDSVTV